MVKIINGERTEQENRMKRPISHIPAIFRAPRIALVLSLWMACTAQLSAQTVPADHFQIQRGAETIGGVTLPAFTVRPARELPSPSRWQPGDPIKEIPRQFLDREARDNQPDARGFGFDALAQAQIDHGERGPGTGVENQSVNRDGVDFTGVNPSDTVGDVGINFYVQMVNGGGGVGGTQVLIVDKTDGTTVSNFALADLAAGSGTGCGVAAGDPIVAFDQTAANNQGRWMLAEMTGNSICVYISQTTDPTGDYFVYEFDSVSGGLPDYYKPVIWSDAFYVGVNEGFGGGRANYAFDRVNMLQGNPARPIQVFSSSTLSGFGFQLLQAVDFDGLIPPPNGAPGIFMRHNDDESHNPNCADSSQDCLEFWEMSIDWDTPANSTFAGPTQIQIAEFDSNLCGLTAFACASQPGSGTTLDPLREPVMWRPQFRNIGGIQLITGTLVTDVDGTDRHGVRWFILERPGSTASGGWTLQQEGTFSPDATNRWMSSSAMDSSGNLLIGYNVSSADTNVFPGMRYAGRQVADTPGVLTAGEFSVIEGSSPNGSNRYGDYSAMVVDPVDDCTFWYTAQYNVANGWSTRMASMRFDACGSPGFVLGGGPTEQQICVPGDLDDITVNTTSINGFVDPITLALNGQPAGSTVSFVPNPVTPGNSSLASIGLPASTPAGALMMSIDGTATGADSRSLALDIDVFTATPGAPVLELPADGSTGVDLLPTLTWTEAAQSAQFNIEIATDPAFANIVYTATETNTAHVVATPLDRVTEHYWRVTSSNPCGGGLTSSIFSFTTRDLPPLLLVDDDDNDPDVRSFYSDTLNALGVQFDVFDTDNTDNEPDAALLAQYQQIIWFTGDSFGGAAGPGSAGEVALSDALSSGRCLLISSQDYLFDRGFTDFMGTYLGLDPASNNDTGDYTSVSGIPGSLYDGLGPYTLDYNTPALDDFSDIIVAAADASLGMDGNNGNGAAVGRSEFQSVLLGFPLPAVDAVGREEVIAAFLDQCSIPLDEVFFVDGFEEQVVIP